MMNNSIDTKKAIFFDNKREIIFFFVFITLCLVEAFRSALGLSNYEYILKPLVMFMIIVDYFSQVMKVKTVFSYGIFFALIMSMFGDIFLMINGYFVQGVAAFGVGHILYSTAYISNIKESKTQVSLQKRILVILPVLIYSFGLYFYMVPGLKDMQLPITIYVLLISTMGTTCALRLNCTEMRSYYTSLAGSVLFIFSDSLIGLSMFGGVKGNWIGPTIMITYYCGQYLISRGALFHIKYQQGEGYNPLMNSSEV